MQNLVLLVEDDEILGKVLKDFFEENGLSIEWAKDGYAAIQPSVDFGIFMISIISPSLYFLFHFINRCHMIAFSLVFGKNFTKQNGISGNFRSRTNI